MHYLLDSRDGQPQAFAMQLILEPGTISIKSDADDPQVRHTTGTPANDAAEAYTAASRALITEYRDAATTDQRREAIEEEFEQLTRTSVEANRDNFFGVMLMPNMAYELSGQEILDQIAKFSPEMQQTKELTELKATAEQKKRTDVGQPYINILQSDAEGQIVTLTSVIENPANKYTLVDFWASWCGPCMGEVPPPERDLRQVPQEGLRNLRRVVRQQPRQVARRRQGQRHEMDSGQRPERFRQSRSEGLRRSGHSLELPDRRFGQHRRQEPARRRPLQKRSRSCSANNHRRTTCPSELRHAVRRAFRTI